MTDSTIGRMPAMRAVWMEQLRVVGLAIRREGVLAGLALALGSLALIAFARVPVLQALVNDEMAELVFDPAESPWVFLPAVAALLLPLVVWKGERRFGDTPLWSMPVDHRRHALLKVAAGWVWLLAILGAALVWAALTTLASGGSLGVDEVRLLVLDPTGATAGTPGAVEGVSWTTPWWECALRTMGRAPDGLDRAVGAPADRQDVDGILRVLDQLGTGGGAARIRPAAESVSQATGPRAAIA